jgi:S1-C subfamily serine protease
MMRDLMGSCILSAGADSLEDFSRDWARGGGYRFGVPLNDWPTRPLLGVALLCALAGLACAVNGSSLRGDVKIERSLIRIVNHSQQADWYSPWASAPTRTGAGSGFVIDGGFIMTNAHVVSDARMLLVYLHGDPTPHEARVVSIAHDCDLALLEPVEEGLLDSLPSLKFGDLPKLGSAVETYGYPAAGQQLSATRGVVSRIEVNRYSHSGLDSYLTVQTDAAINPGNSGGPVVQDGRVVGVAFQAISSLENVGFFIPTEIVRHFLGDLEDGEYHGFPEIGMTWARLENPAARRAAGLGDTDSGVRVELVFPGSSADGHLQEEDILVEVNGYDIANDGSIAIAGLRLALMVVIDRLQSGETIHLGIVREGRRLDIAFPIASYAGFDCYRTPYDLTPQYYIYAGLVFAPLCSGVMSGLGDTIQTQISYEYSSRAFSDLERLNNTVVLLRRLDHPINVHMTWSNQAIVERVNDRRIRNLTDLIEAVEGNREEFHVFEFTYYGRFEVLRREDADRAHPEILERFGVVEDRSL